MRLHAGDTGSARTIEFEDGSTIGAQAVILATGVDYRQLQVTGCWDNPDDPACNYVGRGVYYGASVSDASDATARTSTSSAAPTRPGRPRCTCRASAKSVTLLVRGPSLESSMSYYLIQQIEKNDNIKVRTCTEVVDTLGEDDHLDGWCCRTGRPGDRETVDCGRMFCFIGAEPRTDWLDGVVARDDHGFILAGPDLQGRLPAGRWTARRTTWKQACPACLLQVTCAPSPPSGWPPPSAKGRWP